MFISSQKRVGRSAPAAITFEDDAWRSVSLPHDWAIEGNFAQDAVANHGYLHRGMGWYRKTFRLQEAWQDKELFLHFGAISGNAQVYVNGSLVYRSFSNYLDFVVNITDYARFGGLLNTIAVRVDVTEWQGWWYEGAGMHQGVALSVCHKVHIAHDGIWINPRQAGEDVWDTAVETTLENASYQAHKIQVVSTLLDPSGNPLASASSETLCPPADTAKITQLEAMVKSARNHPSVIIYSLLCEEMPLQGTSQGYRITEKMAHCVQKLDNTRPVTGALNDANAVIVDVEALDTQGRPVPNACDTLEFSVTGGAALMGTGNGNPNGHQPYTSAIRSLFHGNVK